MRSHSRSWLFAKDAHELAASRAWWVLLLGAGLLVGHAFLTSVDAYAEMSGVGGTSAALAQGLDPLDGIVIPTLGSLSLAAMLLLPFVVIRLIAHEKKNGGWQLLVQGPARVRDLLASKLLVLLGGWLVAWTPALIALAMWRAAGNHLDYTETVSVMLGHALFAWITVGVAAAAAAAMDGEANAAIVTLAFTIGTWALEFTGAARGGIAAELAAFTPGAALRSFEQGLVRVSTVIITIAIGAAGIAIASIWLLPGRRRAGRLLLTALVLVGAGCIAALAAPLRPSWDLSEDRRNSFAPADEAALKQIHEPLGIEIHLAQQDPRLEDFRRGVLEKLERLLPGVDVAYVARTTTGLFEQTDSLYGVISYQIGTRRTSSRSVTAETVLESIYQVAGITPPAVTANDYPGYRLVEWPPYIAVVFFAAWPLLLVVALLSRTHIRMRAS